MLAESGLADAEDIRRYYEWVDERLVRPYRDTILMLNLADEPSGGDYSPWAEAEFIARYGYGFADVGDDPTRLMQLGAFQSNYIAEYAAWSAEQWAGLEPDLPTTMSFEGATARVHFHLPLVEAVFARTNGERTFDYTYDVNAEPMSSATQWQAAVVNLFYVVNWMHDWYYDAGFNEPAGNAQTDNYGRGGLANDSMRALAQEFLTNEVRGIAQRGINLEDLRRLPVPMPGAVAVETFERRAIGVSALGDAQSASRQRVEELFASLIHDAFRGDL